MQVVVADAVVGDVVAVVVVVVAVDAEAVVAAAVVVVAEAAVRVNRWTPFVVSLHFRFRQHQWWTTRSSGLYHRLSGRRSQKTLPQVETCLQSGSNPERPK